MKKITLQDFLYKANVVHGSRYDYSKSVYINTSTKMTITCREHGDFIQTPNSHLSGKGCLLCARLVVAEKVREAQKMSQSEFEKRCTAKHGDKYDYSKLHYVNMHNDVIIGCQEHGEFIINAQRFVNGTGCPACSAMLPKGKIRKSFAGEFFAERSAQVHSGIYGYHNSEYVHSGKKLLINCREHGDFLQAPEKHLAGQGCPKCNCGMMISKGEDEIFSLASSLCRDAIQSDRKTISPYELDIYIPSRNLAIEFNGIHWHSDDRKDKHYHRQKFLMCAEKGIRLISITDIEWQNRKEQLTSIIKSALGARDGIHVNARQCVVEEITPAESKSFLDEWHVQGNTTAKKINLGLRTKYGELVAVMTFSQGANYRGAARLAIDEVPWSLSRYATSCTVRGGAGKLFKHAVREYGMSIVESFSTNNFFGGAMYSALGFEKVHDVEIDYQVYHPKCGLRPKSHWQRRLIPKRLAECGMQSLEFNPDKSIDSRTEFEVEDLCGAKRIWDTGKILWRWKNE